MKKNLFPLLALLALVPSAAHAASAAFFGPIVSEACRCPDRAPTYGCVLDTGQRMINFGITIGLVAFTFMLAYAGFVWMTSGGNPEKRNQGRSMLLNVVIGLVIVLTAWLVVDFVMKELYSGDNASKDFGPWNSILADSTGTMCIEETKPTKIGGILGSGLTAEMAGTGNQVRPAPTPVSGNESAVRSQLSAAGVSVNNAACTGSNGSGCTNVGGMRTATVQQVTTLSNLCTKCGIVVTGGSEPGHAVKGSYTHGNGYKVDLRNSNAALNDLLKNLRRTGSRGGDSGGPIFKDNCGNEYVNESNHWDITVYGVCSKLN